MLLGNIIDVIQKLAIYPYKLKEAAGSTAIDGTLRKLAENLYNAAEALKTAASGSESDSPKKEAKELKEAVGQESDSTGLTDALQKLGDDPGDEPDKLPGLATAVKDQYSNVKEKYEAVVEQKDKYTEGKGQDEYPLVVDAWNALNSKYNYVKFDKYFIDGGHEQRQYTDAPKYDVQGATLGERLNLKAKELQDAAKALKEKAEGQSVGGILGTNAGSLATASEKLAGGDHSKATEVISNFDLLETEYDKLGEGSAEKAKVKKEFETVKHIYDRMLNVSKAKKLKDQVGEKVGGGHAEQKIWHHANELYGKANLLATDGKVSSNNDLLNPVDALKKAIGESESAEGSLQKALKELSGATEDDKIVENALNVIDKYDAVVRAFKSVTAKEDEYKGALTGGPSGEFATKYNPVKSQFGLLKSKYNEAKCKSITPIHDKEHIR